MINLTYMISILNFIFIVMFYAVRWSKFYPNCIYFKEILNQLNLLYIYNRTKYMQHHMKLSISYFKSSGGDSSERRLLSSV
jgi:hypothetical protein